MPDIQEEMVDLPSEGSAVTVQVSEETEAEEKETSLEESDEHAHYSKNVQKRIDKLTKKVREAERQQQAAIDFAKSVQNENQSLKGRVKNLDEGYVSEYQDRLTSQNEAVKKELETAIATSDTEAQVEAQQKMARLAIEEERVNAAKAAQAQEASQNLAANQQAQQAQQAALQQAPVRPDPKAENWAQRNSWFGEDDAMTFAAFGIHKTLVEEESFDTNSEEYYAEIDRRMKEAFPHKFTGEESEIVVEETKKPQQAVASATRSSNAGRKTVKLSPSEVAIANKLGVPLNEYAKHKRRGA